MNRNEMKKEFPKTPQTIRNMIEQEVHRQIDLQRQTEQKNTTSCSYDSIHRVKKKAVRRIRKTTIIAAAAVLTLGTTALAGSKLYQIYMEKQGTYGVKTVASAGNNTEKAESAAPVTMEGISTDITAMEIKLNWVPEGMSANEDQGGKNTWSFAETPYQGGLSLFGYKLDEGEVFEVLDENIVESENLQLGEHDGVLLKRNIIEDGGLWMDKILYILYPEYSRVVQMYVGQDVSKEDAIKIAENMTLVPLTDEQAQDNFIPWTNQDRESVQEEADEAETKITATSEEMKNLHKIGEPISLYAEAEDSSGQLISTEDGLSVCATEVQTADDLSVLDQESLPQYNHQWLKNINETGKLKNNTLQFIKSGDGINAVDEIIKTEELGQKLVYVTLEYTNTSSQTLHHIFFRTDFCMICETSEGYRIYNRAEQEKGPWDTVIGTGAARGGMDYLDVQGTGQAKNYIPILEPGETIVVHTAAIVNEDELDKLYLNLDGSGATYEFTEEALEIGYIDIRQ